MHDTRIRIGVTSLAIALASVAGCAKHDAAVTDSAASTTGSTSATTSAPEASTMPTDITPVRGVIASASDSVLVVTTASGDVRVGVEPLLKVYKRVGSTLTKVSEKSFVGVTSEKQGDGSQVATEIHIFPEELRGTGEGSYLMTPPAGSHDSSRSTMTNGTVAASKSSEAPRMTNGAVASKNGETLTVDYHGGSQTIKVPANVKVTAMESAGAKLATGAKVVVIAKKQPDGSLKASSVVLASEPAK